MTKRILTDEEKTLLAAVMQDVAPLAKTKRISTKKIIPTKKLTTIDHRLSATLDLHGLTLDQAYRQLQAFIEAHAKAGSRDLLVITGKSGELMREVPRWLTLSDMKIHVSMLSKAQPKQGGDGALCIKLRKRK